MLDHVRRFTATGGSVIFISHILHEILETSDRIVVMKDGRVVAERPAQGFDHDGLVQAMGTVAREEGRPRSAREQSTAPLILSHHAKGLPFAARKGEIVGLAGLAGHGQTELLLSLHAAQSGNWLPERDPLVTFVAGDRRLNGVFDLWSILRNFSIASLGDLSRRGLILANKEEAKGADWKRRIEIRTPDMDNRILSLSGGNQQKVLFARALATRAPVVLMDDPMRGVDVGTKQEVYSIIREEAARGRTFIWYSTEMDEVRLCDRVYVFREGRIKAELAGDAVNETNIIAASFEGVAA
jgi:ribose transport system ATP-binding protein